MTTNPSEEELIRLKDRLLPFCYTNIDAEYAAREVSRLLIEARLNEVHLIPFSKHEDYVNERITELQAKLDEMKQ